MAAVVGRNSSKGFPEQNPEDSAEAFMRRLVGNKVWERLPERTRTARRSEGRVLVGELRDLRSGPLGSQTRLFPQYSQCRVRVR